MLRIVGPLIVSALLFSGVGIPLVFAFTAVPAAVAALSISVFAFPARSRSDTAIVRSA